MLRVSNNSELIKMKKKKLKFYYIKNARHIFLPRSNETEIAN